MIICYRSKEMFKAPDRVPKIKLQIGDGMPAETIFCSAATGKDGFRNPLFGLKYMGFEKRYR